MPAMVTNNPASLFMPRILATRAEECQAAVARRCRVPEVTSEVGSPRSEVRSQKWRSAFTKVTAPRAEAGPPGRSLARAPREGVWLIIYPASRVQFYWHFW